MIPNCSRASLLQLAWVSRRRRIVRSVSVAHFTRSPDNIQAVNSIYYWVTAFLVKLRNLPKCSTEFY